MKRRSARPVVVEVKRTRSSTSSLAAAFGRSHSSKSLWQGLPLRAEAPTSAHQEHEPPAAVVRKVERDAQPAPRILPSLVPMFVPSEPEPQDEAAEVARSTRRPKVERKPRAQRLAPDAPSVPAEPKVIAEARDAVPAAVEPHLLRAPEPTSPAPATQPHSDRRNHGQRRPELRRGERWKRRLPRACW
jgi:hypothetical protein